MTRIFFAITLSIMILAGCGRNIMPGKENAFPDTTTPVKTDAKNTDILKSEAEIKKIALDWVEGATEKDIRKFRKEYDDKRWKYEVEIVLNKTEYEIEIDAETGEIISWDKESIYD